jgi:D-alanyl-D-alanine carboxypeptidase (penicillin-binding protein 5/6)
MYKYLSSIIALILTITLTISVAQGAQKKSKKPVINRTQTSLVIDGKTGKILHSHNANEKIYPASLTKVITAYLLFEALESGKVSLNQRMRVSKYAADAPPCKLHLKAGEYITVREAILGLIVKSGNDVARVVAEHLAGSEEKFAKIMNARAKQLGMKNTSFANASGLHDPKQKSTAIDLAKLSIAVKRDFPQYYSYFSQTKFDFRGKTVHGHNKLTANYVGAEGLKTGFTNPAGCNLITVATRGDKSLIGIVTGSPSSLVRDKKMVALLDQHFAVNKSNKNVRVALGAKRR